MEGAYIAEVIKFMEYEESKEYPIIQIVRIHQHHTNSTPLQKVKNFKKSLERKKDAWTTPI
jgi:hypothetical protein